MTPRRLKESGRAIEEETMSKTTRGFASMSREKRREIASKAGKAAHAKGTAHEWSRAQARAAGRKGVLARARRSRSLAKKRT